MTATLPTAGRVLVDCLSEAYDVDLDARLAVKLGLEPDQPGDPRTHIAEPFLFDTVELDEGFLLFDADGDPVSCGYVLGVTPIESAVQS